MIASQSKKKIINEAVQNSQRQMAVNAQSILRRAAIEEYKMQDHFKNLESPLEFLHNNKIQEMINETTNLSSKLQNQIAETSELSKNIYKEVISNEDYLKFFQNHTDYDDTKRNRYSMEQALKMQSYLKEKARRKNETQDKTFFHKPNPKIQNAQISKIPRVRNGQFGGSRDKQNIQDRLNQELKYDHIKKLDTPNFEKQCRHVEFYKFLKQSDEQMHKEVNQHFNIDKNQEISALIEDTKFSLIKNSSEFGEKSKDLLFDFDNNLIFQSQAVELKKMFLNQSPNINEVKNIPAGEALRNFIGFRHRQITVNNFYDFAMKKITPDSIACYYKLKQQHKEILQRQKRDDGLDQKYHQMLKQYEKLQQMRSKDKTRKLPTRIINTQTQTINHHYEQQQTHRFFQNIEPVEGIFLKLKKINTIRERAMKDYKNISNKVILKNACLEVNQILFKLILLMLKGQNKFLKNSNSQNNQQVPFFTCSDLINVKDKQEVQRKILQLIYGNSDKFEVQKVDGIAKKKIIQVYVSQKQKNNKIYDIIERGKSQKK